MTVGPRSLDAAPSLRSRAADFAELTKPRITALVVTTTAVGFAMAVATLPELAGSHASVLLAIHTVIATALVAGGASTLNQLLETEFDAQMRRTENRPLPAGRLAPEEALAFGAGLAVTGLLYLTLAVNVLSAVVAGATLALYVFVYTPMKRISAWNTVVGAIPGALPPVIGWAAAAGNLATGAWMLFAILFVWQLPHFLSLAWMLRDDYARAGFPMLTVVDTNGQRTSRHIAATCAAMLPVSLAPVAMGLSGTLYFIGASLLGLGIAFLGFKVALTRAEQHARWLFLASVIYLPLLMGLLLADRWVG